MSFHKKWNSKVRGNGLNKKKRCISIDSKSDLWQQWIGIANITGQEVESQSEYELSLK